MLGNIAVSNVSIVELIWTGLGLIFLYLSAYNLREGYRDLRAIDSLKKNGYLRTIAVTGINVEWCRFGVFSTQIIMGVSAMLTPPTNPDRPVTPTLIIVTVGIFFMDILVGVQSYILKRLRRRLDIKDQERLSHVD